METVTRTAWDPITKQKYKIEMPAPEEVRQAILKLDYPSDGIRIKDTAVALAEKFQLSNDQRNAENSRGDEVFYHDVGVSIEKTYEIKRVDSDYFAENAENS